MPGFMIGFLAGAGSIVVAKSIYSYARHGSEGRHCHKEGCGHCKANKNGEGCGHCKANKNGEGATNATGSTSVSSSSSPQSENK